MEGSEVGDCPVTLLDERITVAGGAIGEVDGQAATDLIVGDTGRERERNEDECGEEEHGGCGVFGCVGVMNG